MSIITPTNFNVQNQVHIDTRLTQPDISARNNISVATRYWGMMVHVLDSDGVNNPNTYILQKGTTSIDISDNGNWVDLSTISVAGADTEVLINTSGSIGTDSDFKWDYTNKTLYGVSNYSITGGSNPAQSSIIIGDSITVSGAGTGTIQWSGFFGDVFEFDNGGTFRSCANMLMGGTGNTARVANGSFGIYSSILYGEGNTIEPAGSGVYAWSIIGGYLGTSRNSLQHVTGSRSDVSGVGAFVHAEGASAAYNRAGGAWSVLLGSSNTVLQTDGHGANANNSAIIGGIDHDIPTTSPRSAILGGNLIKAAPIAPDTVYFPKVRVGQGTGGSLPTTGETHNISINSSTGELVQTDAVFTVKIQLSSAQILALNTTPIQAIAAPGVGKSIQILGGTAWLTFGTTQYLTTPDVHLL